MSVRILRNHWNGQNALGLYCCNECHGDKEVTRFSKERNAQGLNHKTTLCPTCQGVGGLIERRVADRRK